MSSLSALDDQLRAVMTGTVERISWGQKAKGAGMTSVLRTAAAREVLVT
jgi:hypothetical protein